MNSKRLYESSGKGKESRCLVFTSFTKREIRHFHVKVVQSRERNVPKSVMHVQGCCFANLSKPIAFSTFSLPSPSSLLVPHIKQQCREPASYPDVSLSLDENLGTREGKESPLFLLLPWSLALRHHSLAFPTRHQTKFEAPKGETELELGN